MFHRLASLLLCAFSAAAGVVGCSAPTLVTVPVVPTTQVAMAGTTGSKVATALDRAGDVADRVSQVTLVVPTPLGAQVAGLTGSAGLLLHTLAALFKKQQQSGPVATTGPPLPT